MTELVLILLPFPLLAIAWAVVSTVLKRRRRAVFLVVSPPEGGGQLPDFFSGHDWPVNPNRRSQR